MSAAFARHLTVGVSLGLVFGALWGAVALLVAPDISLGWYLAFVTTSTTISGLSVVVLVRE
jgi:hypothetical protein